MSKVAVVTDSNSGITQSMAKELGVYVLPMPFFVDEVEFFEDITLSQEQFYEKLLADADISTSQPSPEAVMKMWDKALLDYDELVYIPMSSGLSGSCQTAMMLAEDYNGKVEVIDNQRISLTMRRSVMDALALAEQGKTAKEIKEQLTAEKLEASIYITVSTLKYLKKGGRLTPAAAALGTLLRIKPVLQIQGEKLDTFSKARTMNHAKSTMIEAAKNDIESRFGGLAAQNFYMDVAYTKNRDEAEKFKTELEAAFPGVQIGYVDPLSLSVSCHIGDGAIAVAITQKHAG